MANGHRFEIIFFALFLLLPELVVCRYRNTTYLNGFDGYEDQDPIKLARCDAICYRKGENEKEKVRIKKKILVFGLEVFNILKITEKTNNLTSKSGL